MSQTILRKHKKTAHCKQMRINECVRDLRHFKCHMKATIVTTLSFHQAKHLPCSVNDDNKNISPCIIWTSYTLRVEPSPCRVYGGGRALRGWARLRACRRLLGRRQRQDHSLQKSHTAALPAPPPRRPISRIKTDRAMIELHECSSQSNRIVAYGSKAGMPRVKQVLLSLLSKPCPCSMAIHPFRFQSRVEHGRSGEPKVRKRGGPCSASKRNRTR